MINYLSFLYIILWLKSITQSDYFFSNITEIQDLCNKLEKYNIVTTMEVSVINRNYEWGVSSVQKQHDTASLAPRDDSSEELLWLHIHSSSGVSLRLA